ncbi:MAG: HAD hydrolase-like protein [Dermatophilaceae bacterium]
MDGTLTVSDPGNARSRAVPGAVELVAGLRARGIPLAILTNGTNRTPAQYATRLREAGLDIQPRDIVTPVDVLVAVCRRRRHRRVMVVGTGAVASQLRRAGIDVVAASGRPEGVDAVFVGWYRAVRFDHIEAASLAATDGARLYSASQSLYYFTALGRSYCTSRSIAVAIRDLTGRRIELLGKPDALALRTVAGRLGLPGEALAVVGDDPELEAPMARRAGAVAVGVHTGVGAAADFAAAPVAGRADLSVPSLADVVALLGW